MKRILTILMVLCLVLSLSISTAAANGQQHDYSTASNSGIRHEICTSLLGTSADDYYTGNYTYEKLSQLDKATLLTTLRTLMTTTHTKETSYDDCKFQATKTDCQNNDGSIVTIYTSHAAQFSDFKNGTGWNREHVWPKSLGGFKNNGAGADLHHIRPSENRTNSNRGNLKYGNVTGGKNSSGNLSGELGGEYNGTFYEPVDSAKGDVARICLYVYVRYGGDLSKCSNITNVFESIDVLLEWCALDPVDTWEMGRNEVVGAIQGNRNVFIDYPELAWKLFGKDVPAGMTTPSTVTETQPTVTQPGTTVPTQAPSSAPTDAPTEPAEEPKDGFPTGPVIAVIGIPAIGAGLFVGLKKKKRDQ